MSESSAELPAAFLERLPRVLPEPWLGRALESFERERPTSLRANTLRIEPAELVRELAAEGFELEPVSWCEESFALKNRSLRELQATDAAQRGAFFVQGLSSQLAAVALEPQPGERVLDLCAAPGGKTAHLSCRMQGRGELVANDRSKGRLFKLRAVLADQGVPGVQICCRKGEVLARERAGSFERVLVDAPCTGEGRFRRTRPESFADWKPAKVKRLGAEQRRLLEAGLVALAVGGVLVYSTCTFGPEENELVVAKVLRRLAGEVELEPLPEPIRALPGALPGLESWGGKQLDPALGHTRRIAPDGHLEGFFLARLRRVRGREDGPKPV